MTTESDHPPEPQVKITLTQNADYENWSVCAQYGPLSASDYSFDSAIEALNRGMELIKDLEFRHAMASLNETCRKLGLM